MNYEVNVDPKFWSKTSWIQLGYGVWASLNNVTMGLAFAFPSVTIPQLINDPSFPVETSDEAWIASVLTLSAPLGCLLSGYVMDKYGRKISLILCAVPLCVGWIYTGLASSSFHIITGRAITGVGCGMSMGTPRTYIAEITLPNMRGVVGVFPNLAMSIGLAMQALLGIWLPWKHICYGCGVFSAAVGSAYFFLQESPYFILQNSTPENAKIALRHFRGASYNIDNEMADLIEFKIINNIRRLTLLQQFSRFYTKAVCQPFWIIITFMLITQLSGVTVLFVWAIDLLEASKLSEDSYFVNTLMGLTRIVVSVINSILMYRMERKSQALISSLGVGFVCLLLSSVVRYKDEPSTLPLFCYILYVMFAALGYSTLPLLMMCELYPLQVRGLLGGITVSILNLMMFGVNNAFPYLRNLVGHANVILIFGVCSLLGSMFLYLFLPETKGLTLQEIEEYFNERRPTLVSQRNVLAAQQTMVSNSSRNSSSKALTKAPSIDENYKKRGTRKEANSVILPNEN